MNDRTTFCHDHQTRTTKPPTCHVCTRLTVEADIVTRVVDALLTAGYALATNQGEGPDANVPAVPTRDRAAILAELLEVDDEFLGVFTATDEDPTARRHDGGPLPFAWVRFVYGNDGYDVINDYTTSLDAVLEPINAYAETLA